MERQENLLIIAHRGDSAAAPENTLISFRKAVEEGAHGIELDVHLSSDGRLIVCHDDTVDRTTNGTGKINDLSYEQLRQLDAGSWFDPQFTGERLPLLEEVFELVPEHMLINIEMKGSYAGQASSALARMLDDEGKNHRVIVSSFDHPLLLELKRHRPKTAIGLLCGTIGTTGTNDTNGTNDTISDGHLGMFAPFQQEQLTVASIHPNQNALDMATVQNLRREGYAIYPYTANSEADWQRLIDIGVSGIITDYPGRLLAYLRNAGN